MIQIIKTDLNEINNFRLNYLDSLAVFQELYLEMLVEDSSIYKIDYHNESIGYAIKTVDDILIEFYIIDRFIPYISNFFQTILNVLTIQKIYCKSFDYLLLNCCLMNSYSYKLIGSLFRDYEATEKQTSYDLTIRFAENNDYSYLLQQEGELYETPEELKRFINGKNVIMFLRDAQLLGCGYLIKVHDHFDYYDIGMWVNPQYRKQGIATFIISYLKDTCLTNHWSPICGCAIENIASQKTLEKNGFVSKHKLIEFSTYKINHT